MSAVWDQGLDEIVFLFGLICLWGILTADIVLAV